MSDRIAVISSGRTLQIDTPLGLYERPSCREVAGFIGTMNFFEAVVVRAIGGVAECDAGALGMLRAIGTQAALRPGQRVTLAIRPEKIAVGRGVQPSGPNAVYGRLVSHSYFGDRSHFAIEVPGLPTPMVASRQNDAETGVAAPQAGADFWIRLPETALTALPQEEEAAVPLGCASQQQNQHGEMEHVVRTQPR
jgi:ABC-type Fe3+/spermidine/putrescine transport system ATPase subunit